MMEWGVDIYCSAVSLSVTIVMVIFSVLLHAWVFSSIQQRRGYPSKYTKFNALISSLLMFLVLLLTSLENIGIISVQENYWGCNFWDLLSRVTFSTLALTILLILYEVGKSKIPLSQTGVPNSEEITRDELCNFRENHNDCPLKAFLLMWFAVTVISLPALEIYRFSKQTNDTRCDKVYIMDSPYISLTYEAWFCSFITFLPSIILVTILYGWRFQFSFLFPVKPVPSGLKRHINKIRLAMFNVTVFTLLWIPIAIILFFPRESTEEMQKRNFERTSCIPQILNLFFMFQIAIQPAIFMHCQFPTKVGSGGKSWYANFCSRIWNWINWKQQHDGYEANLSKNISESSNWMETINYTDIQMINWQKFNKLSNVVRSAPYLTEVDMNQHSFKWNPRSSSRANSI